MEIKKSPKADLERGKSLSILMGFVVGLAVLFVGFEWSTRDVMVVQASEGVADIIAEEEVEITRPENTPPPPPPPPVDPPPDPPEEYVLSITINSKLINTLSLIFPFVVDAVTSTCFVPL